MKQDKIRAEDQGRTENQKRREDEEGGGVDNERKRTHLTFVSRSLAQGFGCSFNNAIKA